MQNLIKQIDAVSKILLITIIIPGVTYLFLTAAIHYRVERFPASVTVRTLDEVKHIREGFRKRGINSCAVIVKYRAGEPEEYAVVAGR